MRFKNFLIALLLCSGLMINACSSPMDDAYKAQEKVHQQRLELVKKYQDCIEKAEKEQGDKAVCEQYLKASEALK